MYTFSMIFASGSGKAKASREDDKRKILHFIAGTPEEGATDQPKKSTSGVGKSLQHATV